jgi:hypothetical protein
MSGWSRGFESLSRFVPEIPKDTKGPRTIAMDGNPSHFRREPAPAEKGKAKPRHAPHLFRPRPDKERKRAEAERNAAENAAAVAQARETEKRARILARRREEMWAGKHLKELKAAMVAAHPDKGGSSVAFIAAYKLYLGAKRMHRKPKEKQT